LTMRFEKKYKDKRLMRREKGKCQRDVFSKAL
jgi:hypothetical protein